MSRKTVFISGIPGQVGSALAELYLNKGWFVVGMKRRSSSHNTQRIDHLFDNPNLKLVYGDITDAPSTAKIVIDYKPDIFINTAAMSHVAVSFQIPSLAFSSAVGVVNCLEAIRQHSPTTKFIQMSSSEMFGNGSKPGELLNEESKIDPVSPYGVAKVSGHQMTLNYQQSYGLDCSSVACFNIESKKRGPTFVSAKICDSVGRIKMGLQDKLFLGNGSAIRNWNHVSDTCDALYKISQHNKPGFWVVGTDESYTVEYFAKSAFEMVGLDYKDYVVFDTPKYVRPLELNYLKADSSKIRAELEWSPKYRFEDILSEMVSASIEKAEQELYLKNRVK